MSVILADDDAAVRSAIRLLVEQHDNSVEIIEVADFEQLEDVLDSARSELLILDWGMIVKKPLIDLLGEWRIRQPGMHVLVISGNPQARKAALLAGADGFISKVDPPELVSQAVFCHLGMLTDGV